MNWFNPRRTFESVVDELADGLGSGAITLSAHDGESPLEAGRELLKGQETSVAKALEEATEKHESFQGSQLLRRKAGGALFEAPVLPTAPALVVEQGAISKGMYIKGEIRGFESLFIDGTVEGSVSGILVVIGRNGQVTANITARDITIFGKLHGDVLATNRVDIRAGCELSGDISAARISIEDGAYFRGDIDLRKPDASKVENELHIGLSARARVEA